MPPVIGSTAIRVAVSHQSRRRILLLLCLVQTRFFSRYHSLSWGMKRPEQFAFGEKDRCLCQANESDKQSYLPSQQNSGFLIIAKKPEQPFQHLFLELNLSDLRSSQHIDQDEGRWSNWNAEEPSIGARDWGREAAWRGKWRPCWDHSAWGACHHLRKNACIDRRGI